MDHLETLEAEEADTAFLQLMHFHHEGAVAMTEDQIVNGGHQPVIDLAQQMMDIQTAEMEEMEQLLAQKGESTLTS